MGAFDTNSFPDAGRPVNPISMLRAGLFFILFPTILFQLQLALAVPLQTKDLSLRYDSLDSNYV